MELLGTPSQNSVTKAKLFAVLLVNSTPGEKLELIARLVSVNSEEVVDEILNLFAISFISGLVTKEILTKHVSEDKISAIHFDISMRGFDYANEVKAEMQETLKKIKKEKDGENG